MCETSAARLANTVLLCCSEWDICGSLHGSPQDTYTNSSLWRSDRWFNSLPSFVNSFLAAKGRWTASVHLSKNWKKTRKQELELRSNCYKRFWQLVLHLINWKDFDLFQTSRTPQMYFELMKHFRRSCQCWIVCRKTESPDFSSSVLSRSPGQVPAFSDQEDDGIQSAPLHVVLYVSQQLIF